MDKLCIACQKAVPDDGRFMSCAECKHDYHLGQTCSGIASKTFTTMGQDKRDVWVCKACRTNKKRLGACPQLISEDEEENVASQLLREIREIKTNVESLPALHEKVDSLLFLNEEFTKLSRAVQELNVAMKTMQERDATREAEVNSLKATVQAQSEQLQTQAEQLQELRQSQNDLEQYSRRTNLEIQGLPYHRNENLRDELTQLASVLEVPNVSSADVVAVHRLPCKPETVPTVLVQFTSVATKENWSNARGRLQRLHRLGKLPKLFFNDNLSKLNRELFWRARTTARERGYEFAWAKGGKIYVKKAENAPLIRVNRVTDIDKIV
ncbi:unnamed protein product [Ixodes hexagonus]